MGERGLKAVAEGDGIGIYMNGHKVDDVIYSICEDGQERAAGAAECQWVGRWCMSEE